MREPPVLSRFTVVLWRPKSPGNVGSVARAMRNMGFGRLRIADPVRYEDPEFFGRESRRLAWRATKVLAARREFPSLDAALADAKMVVGTTSAPPRGGVAYSPRELAPRLLDAGRRGTVALLFGQENVGLTREALARCQIYGTIPSSGAYVSLNLAQAVLLFLYEIRLAALPQEQDIGGAARGRRAPRRRGDGADAPAQSEIEGFYRRLFAALDLLGFFAGTGRAHMLRELRRVFTPALTTRRRLRILEGIVRRMARGRHPRGI